MGLNEYDEKALSKYLCFLLRHKPERAKLDMDKHGWVSVEQLITNVNLYSKYHLDVYQLEKIHGRLFDEVALADIIMESKDLGILELHRSFNEAIRSLRLIIET